jgi:hypothetical protein
MEVVNKLIDTDEALVNQFDSDTRRDGGTSSAATDPSSKLQATQATFRGARSVWTSTLDVQRRRVQRSAR